MSLGHQYFSDIRNDLDVAKRLVDKCYHLYRSSATGIGPEIVTFDNVVHDFSIKSVIYLLRPELVESLVYLYRITGNTKYTDWGWKIFESIEMHTKTKSGYSEIKNVNHIPTKKIEQLVPQRQSLMPDLLLRDMTAQQVADLLAYLGV